MEKIEKWKRENMHKHTLCKWTEDKHIELRKNWKETEVNIN